MTHLETIKRFQGKKRRRERNLYYPNNLPLATPPGENIFEFLIVSKDEIGVVANITTIFANHRVNIQDFKSIFDPNSGTYVCILYADFSQADCIVEEALNQIKSLHFVRNIEAQKTEGRLFDSFLFPLLIRNKIRVLALRMDGLLKTERRLIQKMGSAGSSIIFEVGRNYGTDVMLAMQTDLGSSDKTSLLTNFELGLRATGWGICEINPIGNHSYQVDVEDPPIIMEDERPEDGKFFAGLIVGALEKLEGIELRVSSLKKDLSKNFLSLRIEKITSKTV